MNEKKQIREPETVGALAKQVLRSIGVDRSGKNLKVRRAWEEAAGEEVSACTRVEALKDNVLVVLVESSALMSELAGFRRKEILDYIKEKYPRLGILEIDFKAGTF